ncbi:MAG: hypothetical protein GX621_06115 [Pirellulaceae bacterium]|nr:hypothetical protein [Pirellulaceae bacterium]
MDKTSVDLLLERMFRARRLALRTGGVFLVLLVAFLLDECYAQLLTERGQMLLVIIPMLVAMLVVLVGLLLTCYWVFRVGMRTAGFRYAVGHTLLCFALGLYFLLGVVFVPLLVRSDVERRIRDADSVAPDGIKS